MATVNTEQVHDLRLKSIQAETQRQAELSGAWRQRYTSLPLGVSLHDSNDEAKASMMRFVEDHSPTANVVLDTPQAIMVKYQSNVAETTRDIRVPSSFSTRYFFVR